MRYIGRYGEYLVLSSLLERDIEAYLAINTNQKDYDITAIVNSDRIVRIQVKTTDMNNKGTNNPIAGVDKEYDYLVIVALARSSKTRFFILTRTEAMRAKGKSKHLGVTRQVKKVFEIKDEIACYENEWDKIQNGA